MSLVQRVVTLGILVVLAVGGGAALLLRPSPGAVEAAPARPVPAPAVVPVVAPPAAPPKVLPRKALPVKAKAKPKPRPKPKPVVVVVKAPRTTVRPRLPKPRPKPVVRTESVNQRGQRVLASLHYDWRRLGYAIVFLPERKGYLGYTDGTTKTVTIWIRTRETDLVLAHTIAHELGHVLDFTKGTDSKHALYLSLRSMSPTTPWYGCTGCTDYRTPAGDWAEVFAYWLAGPGDFRSQLGPPPDRAHMLAIAQLYRF